MGKKAQSSPLDSRVGVYKPGRNGGFFYVGHTPLRQALLNVDKADQKRIKAYRATGDKKLKAGLTAYMPAGDYDSEKRSLKLKLPFPSNQVQLDFDGDKKDLKKLFNENEWITAAGISAGGHGMFFLVNTEGKDYDGYFNALVEFFAQKGKQVDLAVSSINELRFVSLPEEVMTREHPTVWRLTKEKPKTAFSGFKGMVENAEVIEVPKEKIGRLHYVDLSSYAGLSNTHGVPMEKAAEYIAGIAFDKKSHLHGKPEAVRDIVRKHYEMYQEQHGMAAARMLLMKQSEVAVDVDLPEITFGEKEDDGSKHVKIVANVLKHYSIIRDIKTKAIYKYNGRFWEEIHSEQLTKFLKECSVACGVPYVRAASLKFMKNITELMTLESSTILKQDSSAFNLKNGVLVFKQDGGVEFSSHDPDRHFTYMLDYEYDPKAKCPRFDKFLDRVMPNQESQDLFFTYVSSVFKSNVKVERMLFLIGSGANGKSTLMEVVEGLFGTACGYATLTDLTSKNADAAQKAAWSIYNKLIAISHDDKGPVDQELYKKLASKDPLRIKSLYSNAFETTDYARLIIGMNQKPRVEASTGARRRFIAIPMEITIPESERDETLKVKLRAELSGILNRVVEAHRRQLDLRKLNDSIKEFSEQIMSESDPIKNWVESMGIEFLKLGDVGTTQSYLQAAEAVLKGLEKEEDKTGTIKIVQPSDLYSRDYADRDVQVAEAIDYLYYCKTHNETHYAIKKNKFLGMLKDTFGEPYRTKSHGRIYILRVLPRVDSIQNAEPDVEKPNTKKKK